MAAHRAGWEAAVKRLVIGLVSASSVALAAPAEAPPPVTKVTLHPDAGVVTRAVKVPCASSPATAAFHGLPPGFDRGTARAQVVGDGSVEGLSLNERVLPVAYGTEVRALDDELEALREKQGSAERAMESAQAAGARAASLRGSMKAFLEREAAVAPKPDVARWTEALRVTRTAEADAARAQLAAEVELRDLNKKIQDREERRRRIAGGAPERSFDADVVVACRGPVSVELSYVVPQARWSPVYEARADEAGGSVKVSLLAEAKQWTGFAWEGVQVTLATVPAARDARPPEAQRLYVGASPKEEEKKVLVRRDEEVTRLESGGAAAFDEGLALEFKVAGVSTVEGDGRATRLLAETVSLPATFSRVLVPRKLPKVVHVAQAKNTARFPLLAGPVDLFSKDGFLGTSQTPRVAVGDVARFAFGLDETIEVRRIILSEDKRDPGFLSSTRRLLYAYRFELTSSAPKAVEVSLKDQIPVSELDDVKVILDREKTTPGFDLAAADGHVTWNVKLAPKETKTIELHFVVEVPEKYDSAGL